MPASGPKSANQALRIGLDVLALFTFALAVPGPGRIQAAGQSPPATPTPRASWGFLTDYEQAAAIDSPQRQITNAMFDGQSGEPPLSDASVVSHFSYHPYHAPGDILPVGSVDAIIAGTVRAGRTFLSNDKTTLYTGLKIVVDQVIADRIAQEVAVGAIMRVVREGGVLKLPSGRILIRGSAEQSMPVMGRRYLMLLQYNATTAKFTVISGLDITGPTPYILDSLLRNTSRLSQGGGTFLSAYGESTNALIASLTGSNQ